jgi:hypothetical protein
VVATDGIAVVAVVARANALAVQLVAQAAIDVVAAVVVTAHAAVVAAALACAAALGIPPGRCCTFC